MEQHDRPSNFTGDQNDMLVRGILWYNATGFSNGFDERRLLCCMLLISTH